MGNQELRLLAYLKKHTVITPMKAWDELGIYRLAAVVHKLRSSGYDIETDRINVTNRFGEDCNVARYTYQRKAVGSLLELM